MSNIRSLTYIYDNNGHLLCVMYNHDNDGGNRESYGTALAAFLYNYYNTIQYFEMGDLAIKLLHRFFRDHGYTCLLPIDAPYYHAQHYEYHISFTKVKFVKSDGIEYDVSWHTREFIDLMKNNDNLNL